VVYSREVHYLISSLVSLVLGASYRSGVVLGESFASSLGSVPTMVVSADVIFLLGGIVVDSFF
jgi:hypothetical protein